MCVCAEAFCFVHQFYDFYSRFVYNFGRIYNIKVENVPTMLSHRKFLVNEFINYYFLVIFVYSTVKLISEINENLFARKLITTTKTGI